MTLAELQRALTSVEPAAVLVPPRVMESIVRQVLQLSAWSGRCRIRNRGSSIARCSFAMSIKPIWCSLLIKSCPHRHSS